MPDASNFSSWSEHRRMLNDVTRVEPRGRYRLWLQFQDGIEGEIDLEPQLTFQGVFAPLHDPTYFARGRVKHDLGTISWPNDADCDQLVIYSFSTRGSMDTM